MFQILNLLRENPNLFVVRSLGRVLRGSKSADELYLRLVFRVKIGHRLDLENPKTFNEKLQWLKLNDRNPLYTRLADKYLVKEWVAERIGENYIVPTLGVWDSFDDIDFDTLPEQFVLKCTHDSGGLVICRDKATLDIGAARRKIERSLGKNYYYNGREWPYKNIQPRILAEEFLEPVESKDIDSNAAGSGLSGRLGVVPDDYKFFCFDGKVRLLFVATGRGSGDTRFDFYNEHFEHMPFLNGHPNADIEPSRPETFEMMVELAERLSIGIPHVRVDFYDVGGRIYFGEMTFYHFSGLVPFQPDDYDALFGRWLVLPELGRGVSADA